MLSRINLACEVSLALMTSLTQAAGWADAGFSLAESTPCTMASVAAAPTDAPMLASELNSDIHL